MPDLQIHGIQNLTKVRGVPSEIDLTAPRGHVVVCRCGHQTRPAPRIVDAYYAHEQHLIEEWRLVNGPD
jgi:hypothetical protein